MPELYKLENDARPGQLGGPPFILGSALRVPSYAYENWEIRGDETVLFDRSLMTYQDEFGDTSPAWMESVVQAAQKGGIGNRPQMLRDAVAQTAARITEKLIKQHDHDAVTVLDVGAGAGGSMLAYLKALESISPSYLERVYLTLVDLSRGSLLKAEDALAERGFVSGENLQVVHSRDIDMARPYMRKTQQIVINVAGIHANAYMSPVFRSISELLYEGGYFISGDWHHARWEHPSHTYQLLDKMDADHFEWLNKGAVMDEFLRRFPAARTRPDLSRMSPTDVRAIEEIENYWRNGWAEVRLEKIRASMEMTADDPKRFKPTDEQIVLEGHRPIGQYIKEGVANGLYRANELITDGIISANPQQVVPDTSLNMLLVLRKDESELRARL